MLLGLKALDKVVPRAVKLIIGGGGAMLLAHPFPLSTTDIYAIPQGLSSDELKPFIERVAKELDFPPDWLNPWFGCFTHVLPADLSERLIKVLKAKRSWIVLRANHRDGRGMKQVPVPSPAQLKKAYEYLQLGQHTVTTKQLVLWSQWSRLDARLAQILVEYIQLQFQSINPMDIWRENGRAPMPQALPVLCEFAALRLRKKPTIAKAFFAWFRGCFGDLPAASPQLFFIPEGHPNQARTLKEISETLRPYAKWGFFSNEWIAQEKASIKHPTATLMNSHTRRACLTDLLKIKSVVTVSDYIQACSGRINRRMAERDLKSSPLVSARGYTRNLIYKKV